MRHCLTEHHFYGQKLLKVLKRPKVFQCLSKSKFLNFVIKVNPNNGNETKSRIFISHKGEHKQVQ